ncbi:AAA family ATPase [Tistlia consotensis]|uniref:AAA family ATPase n=1 Tax=Tistlia consotensis TaxID=1321365 RepID=UPI00190EA236|nr:AAA family ATPase [Tistlia consotensis]
MPLSILANLAQACQDVKARLTAEINAIEAQTPAVLAKPECKPNTAVGKLIALLSEKTLPEKVEKLAGLNKSEEERLRTLTSDLAADPIRLARQLKLQVAHLKAAIVRLEQLSVVTTEETQVMLGEAHKRLTVAKAAAAAASANLFSGEPLPDIGSDVWKALWQAARTYSIEVAYPTRTFPVTGPEARCVLCQQPLSEEASRRLGSFEEFVKNESERQEQEATEAYNDALESVRSKAFPLKDLPAFIAMLRDGLGREELAAAIRREVLLLNFRLRNIIRNHQLAPAPGLAAAVLPSTDALRILLAEIENRAAVLESEADSPARAALIGERDELTDRRWLGLILDDVLAQINRLRKIAEIRKASKATTTNKITTESARVAEALVTNRLRSRFAIEVDKLGIAGLAIELQQTRTSAGVPFFQVRFINKPAEPIGKILSEGEHRCVALAAFLAELSTVDAQSGIVFDDPVSSLDHLHRDKVASRLAEASRARQVIVFTHDIAFLLLLDEAHRSAKGGPVAPVAYRLISRGADNAGYCHSDPPSTVMPLDKVIDGMRKHLTNVRIHSDRGDQEKWHREVKSFQEQLRSAWERAAEEVVGPVVRRLQRKVDTTGLIKLTVLTESDCHKLRDAFGRCSGLLHSQPSEINPKLPTPDDIQREIEGLDQWLADIRARQEKAT